MSQKLPSAAGTEVRNAVPVSCWQSVQWQIDAFSASTSRSRTGAVVCSESSSRRAASETSVTARWNAAAFACDGALKPESLRTNCSAEARISSSLAGGAKLNSVRMLRHIAWLLVGRRSLTQALPWAGTLCSSDLNLVLL